MSKPFRIWDSIQIHETVKLSTELRLKIENICEEHHKDPGELPDSLVPTGLLYMLAASNEAMYQKLLEQDLLKTGNPKFNLNIH